MGWSFVFPSNIGTQRSVTLPLTKQNFCIFQPAFAKNVRLLQIKNSWIPTVSVPKLLFCILWARHPKSFWDTLSQNYIKCFRHYSRWVFVSLNWDFFPVLTQISGRAWDWRSSLQLSLENIFVINQSVDFYWLKSMQFCPAVTLASCSEGNGPLMSAFVVLWPISDQFPPGGRGIEICWCKWLKVWDNVSLNNQEMGSKRTVNPEPEPQPPSSALVTFIRALSCSEFNFINCDTRLLNADIVAALALNWIKVRNFILIITKYLLWIQWWCINLTVSCLYWSRWHQLTHHLAEQ